MIKLGELGRFFNGKGLPKSDLVQDEEKGTPCLRYAEIYTQYGDTTTRLHSRATDDGARGAAELLMHDIVFAASGETAEEIGMAVGYLGKEEAVVGGDTVILRGHGQDTRYLCAVLNSNPLAIQKASRGKGYSVVHIHAQELAELEFWLHEHDQQERIAAVLDAWDQAILAVERLAERKARLTRDLTNQLICEAPDTVSLKQLVEINRRSLGAATPPDYEFEYFAIGEDDEEEDSPGWMSFSESPSRARRLAETGDIIYSTVRPMLRRIFRAPKHDQAVYSTGYAVLGPKRSEDGNFLLHAMTSELVERQVFGRLTGSNYPAIATGDLATIQLPALPPEKRTKIGDFLEAKSGETRKLRELAGRYRLQKRGLMQRLLTAEWPGLESIEWLMPGDQGAAQPNSSASA